LEIDFEVIALDVLAAEWMTLPPASWC